MLPLPHPSRVSNLLMRVRQLYIRLPDAPREDVAHDAVKRTQVAEARLDDREQLVLVLAQEAVGLARIEGGEPGGRLSTVGRDRRSGGSASSC